MTTIRLAMLGGALLVPVMSGTPNTHPDPVLVTSPSAAAAPVAVDTLFAHADYLDPIATVLGWPVLRNAPLASAGREVRVWAEGGMAVTGNVLRLTDSGGAVKGELAVYWSLDPSEKGAYGGGLDAQMKARFGCAKAASDTAMIGGTIPLLVGACVAQFKSEPDWGAVLKELEAQQLWTLDETSEDARMMETEAEPGVVVELVQNGTYRTYHYPNVRSLSSANAAHAASLLGVVERLSKQVDRGSGPPGTPIP